MFGDRELTLLEVIRPSLKWMEEQLPSIYSNMESLKKAKQPATQLPYITDNTGNST